MATTNFNMSNASQGWGAPRDLSTILIPSSIFSQGGLYTWGRNFNNQLGDNTTVPKSSPVQTSAGGINWKSLGQFVYNWTGAIKTDGTLWMWGYGNYASLGTNSLSNAPQPTQTISSGTNWKQLACGASHTGAIKTDGTLWMWGENGSGQTGDNTTVRKSSPVQTISTTTNWKSIALGNNHSVAIKTDGTLWLWGAGTYGVLGTNNLTARSSPVQTVSTGTNWKLIVASMKSTAALKTDGTLWLWGNNAYGQIGDNTTVDKSSPVQTISSGTNWNKLAGFGIGGAIKTDGTLWLWGRNAAGQLGDNTVINKSSPVQTISSGTNWSILGCAADYGSGGCVSAIKTDGTLWLWGEGTDGILGNNSTTSRSSPVQTIATGTNWIACSSTNSSFGSYNSMGLRSTQ